MPLSGDYELTRDIDASASRVLNHGEGFRPIGSADAPFTGAFYGNGFKVGGLYINRPDDGHVGFFGFLGEGARVTNLSVIADTVIGRYAVGALAGGSLGVVRGCYSSGFIQGKRVAEGSNVGGLVGVNGGRVSAGFSGAAVNGDAHVGGLVGFLTGEVSECYATGAVSGNNYVGGLVGYAFGGAVDRSFSTGMVIGTGAKSVVGGLVGYDFGGSSPSWNYAGRVTAGSGGGKLVEVARIVDCYWNINTSGIATSAGGTGASTAEMAAGGIFSGWDFDSVWVSTDSSFYPLLQGIPVIAVAYRAEYNGKLEVRGAVDRVDQYVMALGEGAVGLEVTAVPNSDYVFVRWSDGDTSRTRRDAAVADTMFAAEFAAKPNTPTKTLAYTAGGNGRIRINGPGSTIESGGYTLKVLVGQYGVEVTAVPDPGYVFFSWSDGLADSVRRDRAVADREYMASFVRGGDTTGGFLHVYSADAGGALRINGGGNGTYSESVARGGVGSAVVAVPYSGYRFLKWNDDVASIVRADTFEGNSVVMAKFGAVRSEDAIPISSVSDIRRIGRDAGFPLGGVYRLTASVDARGAEGFEPIGTRESPFTGVFYGGGFTISGLRVDAPGVSGAGLFGYVKGASIVGVFLGAVSVVGGDSVGGLVGYCENAFIDRCGTAGSVSGGAGVGGLVGCAVGSVVDLCHSSAAVSAVGSAGGLVGVISGGEVFQSDSAGAVSGGGEAGGFAGVSVNGGRALMCYWDAEASGVAVSAGGAYGRETTDMWLASTYRNWSIGAASNSDADWYIANLGYPSLITASAAFAPAPARGLEAVVRAPVVVRIVGGKLIVSAPAASAVAVRLLDMRGKTTARYNSGGPAAFPLAKVPAGRYIAETKINGKRADVRRIAVGGRY